MNSMTTAMAQAGIALPSKIERMWKIVKDNPNISAKSAGQKANIQQSSASSLMTQLEQRGMVTSKEEVRRIKLGQGFGTRGIKVFSVPSTMQKYELLPLPKSKAAAKTKSKHKPATPHTHVQTPAMAEAKPAQPKMSQSFAEVFMMNHSAVIAALQKMEPNVDIYTLQVSGLLQLCAKHGVKISFS